MLAQIYKMQLSVVSCQWRCCINVVVAKFVPFPRDLSPSFSGIGHGFRDPHHAIEHRTSQPCFRFLVLLISRAQLPPNELFVAAYVGFNDRAAMIATGAFPLSAALTPDGSDDFIAGEGGGGGGGVPSCFRVVQFSHHGAGEEEVGWGLLVWGRRMC